MAVYTKVTFAEAEDFLKNYNIGSLTGLEGITQGVENTNYFLDTDQGRFVLTIFEKRVNEEDLPYFLGFSEHLSNKNIACPKALYNKNGQNISTLGGKKAVIITFLEGKSHMKPSLEACHSAGKFFANLHIAQEGFKPTRKNEMFLEGWKDLFAKISDKTDRVHPDLYHLIQDEITYLESHLPTNLPTGHIHADLFTDNVFFKGEEVSGVIDFYFSCTDILVYDLAICLNAWCFNQEGEFIKDRAEVMLSAYQSVRPLSSDEHAALNIFLRASGLRFLLTRSHDWIFHDENAQVKAKDPMEYYNILTFHQNHNIFDMVKEVS